MSIRFPKSCKTREARSALASLAARRRWEKVHSEAAGEPVRRKRVLIALTVLRCGIDDRPVLIQVCHDGLHQRKQIEEDGRTWTGVYGRKALVKWFGEVLRSAGV